MASICASDATVARCACLGRVGKVTPAQLRLYRSTVFVGRRPAKGWPTEFAVITAWAPTGQKWTPARNRAADLRLRRHLIRLGLRPVRITGASPDRVHREPGWLVAIDRSMALEIGRKFQQIAVFHVRRGRVSVLPCFRGRAAPFGWTWAKAWVGGPV